MNSSRESLLFQLCTAIENKNADEVRTLIEQFGGYGFDYKIPNDSDGHTPLHKVTKLDAGKEILKLFTEKKCIDLNVKDNRGVTALYYVIERENFEEAQILIEAGADIIPRDYKDGKTMLHLLIEKHVDKKTIESLINMKNRKGENSLFAAVSTGNMEIINLLIEYGCDDLKCVDNLGYTLLHQAAWRNIGDSHFEVAEMLLKNSGLDVNAQSRSKYTALHSLPPEANARMIDLFLKYEAQVNIKNDFGQIPLNTVFYKIDLDAVKLLIDHGSDINSVDNDGSTFLHKVARSNRGNSHIQLAELLFKNGADANIKDKDEKTPLNYLVRDAESEIVQLFLRFGADGNIKDCNGKIPLITAVEMINLEIMQLLLDNGSDVNSVIDGDYENGLTPLLLATRFAENDKFRTFETLLKNGANVNFQDKQGQTPLHHLVRDRNNMRTIKLLLDYKPDFNIKDNYGRIPLFYPIRDNVQMVQLLVDHGSDVNCIDNYKSAPLHKATVSIENDSNLKITEILLKNGANVNFQDNEGKTPLHHLASNSKISGNNVKTLKLLLGYKPDVNVKDNHGQTPIFVPIRWNNIEIVQLLIDHGSDANCINNYKTTLLHGAASHCEDFNILKYFLKNSADANALDAARRNPLLSLLLSGTLYKISTEKNVQLLLRYSDVNTIDQFGRHIFSRHLSQNTRKILLEHVAKLQALDVSIDQRILNFISNQTEFNDYFMKCTEELAIAKNTKLQDCWVTFFNLLVDDRKKLKNYAGNYDLIKEFEKSDCIEKFPIYGPTMEKNMKKGIEKRKLFDESAEMLSNNWPIFGPTHLIVRDILDCCLSTKDLSKFCK